jgi:hypothetical protein
MTMNSQQIIHCVERLLEFQAQRSCKHRDQLALDAEVRALNERIDKEKTLLVSHTQETQSPICVVNCKTVFIFPVPPNGYSMPSWIQMLQLQEIDRTDDFGFGSGGKTIT